MTCAGTFGFAHAAPDPFPRVPEPFPRFALPLAPGAPFSDPRGGATYRRSVRIFGLNAVARGTLRRSGLGAAASCGVAVGSGVAAGLGVGRGVGFGVAVAIETVRTCATKSRSGSLTCGGRYEATIDPMMR